MMTRHVALLTDSQCLFFKDLASAMARLEWIDLAEWPAVYVDGSKIIYTELDWRCGHGWIGQTCCRSTRQTSELVGLTSEARIELMHLQSKQRFRARLAELVGLARMGMLSEQLAREEVAHA